VAIRDRSYSSGDLLETAQRVASLARRAGTLLLNEQSLQVRSKPDGSIVTDAEVQVEKLLTKELVSEWPGSSVLSEEDSRPLSATNALWIVDPLDGTTNYVSRQPLWGISIALFIGHRPSLAVIQLPALGQTFSAVQGKGALSNGVTVRTRATDGLGFQDIYTFCSWRSHEFHSSLPGNVRAFGSTAYHATQVAAGHTAGSWELSAKTWDVAAALLLVKEAGGIAKMFDGRDPDVLPKDRENASVTTFPIILAANRRIWKLMKDGLSAPSADEYSNPRPGSEDSAICRPEKAR
jgi:myo-inositol-1(or 4)-monophosphatase